MPQHPNVLFLMTDQMQGRVLAPDHPCRTPNFDRLIARGVRVADAYTPNAVCSPARASLMTGRLPHRHNVKYVTHCAYPGDADLDRALPHWAQHLEAAGYRTGYFGKWHVENSNQLDRFGWQIHTQEAKARYGDRCAEPVKTQDAHVSVGRLNGGPRGYRQGRFYGVVDTTPEQRPMGQVTAMAEGFLDEALRANDGQPWCCLASTSEPHDPFVCGEAAYAQYDVDALPVPENWSDTMADKPGLYRRSAEFFAALTEREKKEAAACYYASITEIDAMFGRLIDKVEQAGQLENTIVVLTSDHGDFLGAHGLYMKNVGAFEEAYQIPMVLAGPGIAAHGTVGARVGLHDLGPTLCELTGARAMDTAGESRSFADLLRDPAAQAGQFTSGYAEYFGSRIQLQQRVVWDGRWKLVFNAFDYDELYDLQNDPGEMHNLAHDPAYREAHERLTEQMWRTVQQTKDAPLANMHYPPLRFGVLGPTVGHE